VRRLALDTVAEFEEEKASQLILAALNDPEASVRSAAAHAAGRARAFSTVFSLILSLEDPELEVRQVAKQAIEIITGDEVDLDPAADAALREPKIEELKRWWKEQRMAQLANRLESESS
jgi:HEAT repeat protein